VTAEDIDATEKKGSIDKIYELQCPPGKKKTQGRLHVVITKIPPRLGEVLSVMIHAPYCTALHWQNIHLPPCLPPPTPLLRWIDLDASSPPLVEDDQSKSLEDGLGASTGGSPMENEPNCLVITKIQCNKLMVMDQYTTKSSDPYVVVRLEPEKNAGKKQELTTAVQKKNLNPLWAKSMKFLHTDKSNYVTFSVYDKDTIGKDEFIGFIKCPLGDLPRSGAEVEPLKSKQLLNKDGNVDSTLKRGEISVRMKWAYQKNTEALGNNEKKKGFFGSTTEKMFSSKADDDDDSDEFSSDEDEVDTEEAGVNSSEAPEVSEADRKAEEERKAKEKEDMLSELGSIEVKSGDYRISIHVIEVRDLAPKDANGLADPIVFVEALGDKFNTCVKERTLNAVFNETFIIDKRNVDKEELEQGTHPDPYPFTLLGIGRFRVRVKVRVRVGVMVLVRVTVRVLGLEL
jgi:hypothetical protein